MQVTGRVWLSLTEGERLVRIRHAVEMNRRRWAEKRPLFRPATQ